MLAPEVAGLGKALALLTDGLPPCVPEAPGLHPLEPGQGQAQPLAPVLLPAQQVHPGLRTLLVRSGGWCGCLLD